MATMINTNFFQQFWVFRGQLVVPKGEKVFIKMARYNLLVQKFEAQEIEACNLGIKFKTDNPGQLYQMPFSETNITGIIDNIVIKSLETEFLLIALPVSKSSKS